MAADFCGAYEVGKIISCGIWLNARALRQVGPTCWTEQLRAEMKGLYGCTRLFGGHCKALMRIRPCLFQYSKTKLMVIPDHLEQSQPPYHNRV